MSKHMIKIEHVSKVYRLGEIGGTTLRAELQSWWARRNGKADPNEKIGQTQQGARGEKFLALDDISFNVSQGETVGVIGGNGAGKSTLLKILSRVTAPTKGNIFLNGRVASMLEVGTGFHPDLTGRENVYLNGAILGMTRTEIDSKFDAIVKFAEMDCFIDTPVKRYSSGMYVKLAFAVASHLESEIMIIDEVLAVGDMKFQQKCLGRMGDASSQEGRTILYVSHNMHTVRQLCQRCIVLDHGHMVFDGPTDQAIDIYSDTAHRTNLEIDLTNSPRHRVLADRVHMTKSAFQNTKTNTYTYGDIIKLKLTWNTTEKLQMLKLRFHLITTDGSPIGVIHLGKVPSEAGTHSATVQLDTCCLAMGKYKLTMILYEDNEFGAELRYDCIDNCAFFEILNRIDNPLFTNWNRSWGNAILNKMGTIVTME